MNKRKRLLFVADIIAVIVAFVLFGIPFLFMLVNSLKERTEANLLSIVPPKTFNWNNFIEVIQANDFQILTAFKNSLILVVISVAILIVASSMSGYVMQRKNSRAMKIMNSLIMTGLMVPAAILPTIWVLQTLNIYKTLFSMVMIEVALQTPFTIMLYRGFMSSIPIELEEAAYIDGCSKGKIFAKIIFPLLKPVTATVIILCSVNIFNDFTNPLYFLPGSDNVTVQLTLYNFMGQYSNSYNLLFADVIIITIPMLILFIFFNKKIVDGMVAGSVKG